MTVYVDVLIGLNLFVNFFLLSGVAKIMKTKLKLARNLAASFVLAVSSLVVLLPPMNWWQGGLFRLLTAAAGVVIGFGCLGISTLIKLIGGLFSATFLFAGVMYALFYWVSPNGLLVYNGTVYYNLSPVVLVAATLVSYLVLYLLRNNFKKENAIPLYLQLHLQQEEITCSVQAKLDTGFGLTDLYSDRPLVLLSPSVANRLFSPEELSLRLIPYETVGEIGLLSAGVCKRVTACYGTRRAQFENVVIAVAKRELQEEFKALVGVDFMERIEWDVASNQTNRKKLVEKTHRPKDRLYRRIGHSAAAVGQTNRETTDGAAQAGGLVSAGDAHHP